MFSMCDGQGTAVHRSTLPWQKLTLVLSCTTPKLALACFKSCRASSPRETKRKARWGRPFQGSGPMAGGRPSPSGALTFMRAVSAYSRAAALIPGLWSTDCSRATTSAGVADSGASPASNVPPAPGSSSSPYSPARSKQQIVS
jgi:hypothetical protein